MHPNSICIGQRTRAWRKSSRMWSIYRVCAKIGHFLDSTPLFGVWCSTSILNLDATTTHHALCTPWISIVIAINLCSALTTAYFKTFLSYSNPAWPLPSLCAFKPESLFIVANHCTLVGNESAVGWTAGILETVWSFCYSASGYTQLNGQGWRWVVRQKWTRSPTVLGQSLRHHSSSSSLPHPPLSRKWSL